MPFKVGGDFFSPPNGRYIGVFRGTEDGPVTKQNKERNGVLVPVEQGTIRWLFDLYNQDGTPVINPSKPGVPAIGEGLSSDTVGVGRGTPAKGRVWLTKLLESKGLTFVEPRTSEDVQAMVTNAIGAYAFLTFGNNRAGKPGTLVEVERYSGAAPAPAPAPVAPVAAPVFAAPAFAAPQPIPAPAPVAAPAAAAIPAMPFPAATVGQ